MTQSSLDKSKNLVYNIYNEEKSNNKFKNRKSVEAKQKGHNHHHTDNND